VSKGVFRSLRRATKGAAFGIRHPLKRVDRNFIIWCGISQAAKPPPDSLHNFAASDKFPEKLFLNTHKAKTREFPEIEGNSVEKPSFPHTFPRSFPQFRKSFRQVSEIIM